MKQQTKILIALAIKRNRKLKKYPENPIFLKGYETAKTETPIIKKAVDSNISAIVEHILLTIPKEIVLSSFLKNPQIMIPQIRMDTIPDIW